MNGTLQSQTFSSKKLKQELQDSNNEEILDCFKQKKKTELKVDFNHLGN